MKNLMLFSIVAFLLFPGFVSAQDAKNILSKVEEAAAAVKNGSYEMIYRWKPMTKEDTTLRTITTEFEKEEKDTTFKIHFRLEEASFAQWYTGEELIWVNKNENSATIISAQEHNDFINNVKHNYTLFKPVTDPSGFFKAIMKDETSEYHINPNNSELPRCINIIIKYADEHDTLSNMTVFNHERQLWIDTLTFLPIRYDQQVDMVMHKDTMHQYISMTLIDYSYNIIFDVNHFNINKLPNDLMLKNFTMDDPTSLLSVGAIAPAWQLKDLNGNNSSLKEYTGKLVLIDFFYKSCFPCFKALPVLQSLHDKYNEKGLKVIGIDPVDKDANDLKTFLAKRGVTYTIFLSEKTVAQDYSVTGYPTLYLLDKTGKILYSHTGYSQELEAELEEIIRENL